MSRIRRRDGGGDAKRARGRERTVMRVADGLHSAAIHLLRRIRAADRKSGLTPQRLSALSVVVYAGPVAMGGLAEAEQVSAPTISRLVKGLERDGLVRRRRDPDDERSTLVEASAEGRRLLQQGRTRRLRALAGMLEDLGSEEIRLLGRAADLMERLGRAR